MAAETVDQVARAKEVEELMKEELEASSKQSAMSVDIEAALQSGPRPFPLAAVVGQESVKTAVLLAAVNPRIGGIVIAGSKGTAKSVIARAVHQLLPPIEVVKGSPFNIDKDSGEFDSFLQAELDSGAKKLEDIETEVVKPTFVTVPLDVLEDRIVGAVDIEKSVATGQTVFDPGLLAKAHRGVLYIDDINLLDESASNLLLEALSTGSVTIEREGLSVRHPCRPLLIATFNPEEGPLRDHLLDRIGVSLSVDAEPLTQEQRIEAVDRALRFSSDPKSFSAEYDETQDAMKTQIIFAREYLKGLEATKQQKQYVCEEAVRAGVQGHRGELFAVQAALASAALEGHDRVEADDLQVGVKLCVVPRGTEIQMPPEDEMMQAPPPPPPPSQEEEGDEQEKEEEKEEEEQQEDQEDSAPPIPEEFMFDIEGVILDPDIMKFATKAKVGRSGARGLIFSEDRGRYIKPMIPKGKVTKLAIDATMRSAAPYQSKRRERAEEAARNGDSSKVKPVYIETNDFRAKKLARKAGSLIVFVVDASGSMALNRMNAAKGAAVNLLEEAYQSRDKVALISFQGDFAQVLLPPTKSITMAKNRLERMPCGGGSPLAHALTMAAQTGMTAQRTGDTGEVVVVLISDGRANVPLSKSLGEQPDEDAPTNKTSLKEEALNTATTLGVLPGFKLLVLDSENKFVSTGLAKELADAGLGKYHYIPKASEAAVSAVASEAIAAIKMR
jgi:magnesium chelatase subunit D